MNPMPTLRFRTATPDDCDRILTIIRQAQAQMRALGSAQWQDGYPARPDIEADIIHERGIVAQIKAAFQPNTPEGQPSEWLTVGYAAVVFDGEPAYTALEGGCWQTPEPYVVVHRLAVADEAKRRGIATALMLHAAKLAARRGIRSFRIDTAHENHYMQALLARLGFSSCGTVRYRSGERIAYERLLPLAAGESGCHHGHHTAHTSKVSNQ